MGVNEILAMRFFTLIFAKASIIINLKNRISDFSYDKRAKGSPDRSRIPSL